MTRWLMAMAVAMLVAGCGMTGYHPPPGDQSEPVHGDSGGGGGGGSM